jgi:hypothetical protein
MNVKEYQDIIKNELKRILSGSNLEIEKEWSSDVQRYKIYSPRLDLAVGPFAKHDGKIYEYNVLQGTYNKFIQELINLHNSNLSENDTFNDQKNFYSVTNKNINARCFLAVEVENKVSRKHLMGSAINASALGKIGLLIAFSNEKFEAIKKLEKYFSFLKDASKNTFNTDNLLILNKDQFLEYLQNYHID